MLKYVLLLAAAFAVTHADAEVFKCRGADGKLQFSDIPCRGDARSEVVPDRTVYVTPQQRSEAQQRALRMQREAAAIDAERAAALDAQRAEQQRRDAESARQAAAEQTDAADRDAISACVRDVERQPASQRVKAEMIAACRTAGVRQRATGLAGDVVNDCVRNVERTGAAGSDKARQLALCHGGDVRPEPFVRRAPVAQAPLAIIKSCSGATCSDQMGMRYTTTAGKTVRSDGARCDRRGNAMYCD